MIVSVKVSLKHATATKQAKLNALSGRLRACTGQFIRALWVERGKLDAATLNRVSFPQLSYRHRSNCLKVALEVVVATCKAAKAAGKRASCPQPPHRMPLSSLVCDVAPGKGSFDYVLKISSLVAGRRILIPFKSHAVLNKWLAVPGARLLPGAIVNETEACLWIEIPDMPEKGPGEVLAVDAGLCKLLVDSEGQHYGQDCREILAKVRRRKPGSKGKQRAIAARRCHLNAVVKQLPFRQIAAIAHENLTNIKHGRKKNRSKQFRKLIAPWTVRQVFSRIAFLARLNRVRVVAVDPRDTSRTCPACRHVASENRKGELFLCLRCGHRQDADEVGAQNILHKALATLGSLWSPSIQPRNCGFA